MSDITIRDIDIPFQSMLRFLSKWALAAGIVGTVLTFPLLLVWAMIVAAIIG